MVKCTVCGSDNEADALFCGTCGSALTPTTTTPVTPPSGEVVPTAGGAAGGVSDGTVVPRDRSRIAAGEGSGAATGPSGQAGATGTGTEPGIGTEPLNTGASVICGVCGTVNDASRVYCRKCANELHPATPPPPPPPPRPSGRRISPVLLAVAALGAIAIIALGAFVVMGTGGTPKPSASSIAFASPTAPVIASPSVPSAPPPSQPPSGPTGRIVYAAGPDLNSLELFTVNADGSGTPAQLTGSGFNARDVAVSPDGNRVVYVSTKGLQILDITAGTTTSFTTFAGDTDPFFDPVDEQIVFAGTRTGQASQEIRIKRIPSTDSTQLTSNSFLDHDPVFTPDGQHIVWVAGTGTGRELWTMDIDGLNKTRLTKNSFTDVDPAVSPDGTQILFASDRGKSTGFDLYLYDIASKTAKQLTSMPGDEHDGNWSPDGRFIAFQATPNGAANAEDIYILDLATKTPVVLVHTDAHEIAPAWGP